jgi:hypothetical protein
VANGRSEFIEAPSGAAGACDVAQALRPTAAAASIAADDRNTGVTEVVVTPRRRERVLIVVVHALTSFVIKTPSAQ